MNQLIYGRYEQRTSSDGRLYYVDHQTKITMWELPQQLRNSGNQLSPVLRNNPGQGYATPPMRHSGDYQLQNSGEYFQLGQAEMHQQPVNINFNQQQQHIHHQVVQPVVGAPQMPPLPTAPPAQVNIVNMHQHSPQHSPTPPPRNPKHMHSMEPPKHAPGGALLEDRSGFEEVKTINAALDQDTRNALRLIDDFMQKVKSLDDRFCAKLNPPSLKKGVLKKMTAGAGVTEIKLTREEKDSTLADIRNIQEKFNQFMFDWNTFSKKLSERDFNKYYLILGDFIEHLQKFRSLLIKSETLADALNKLQEKFKNISVNFHQEMAYSNRGQQTATLGQKQTVTQQGDSTLYVKNN